MGFKFNPIEGTFDIDTDTTGSGEANTASNVGTAGIGIFKTKSGVDLQFKKLNAGSSKITVTDDVTNSEVDIDVVPSNISHTTIADIGTNSHASIDSHIASTSNPHGVTADQIGFGIDDSPTLTGLTLSGLTIGSILFAGTSGAISQDNTNIFWDNTNKRLSIGGQENAFGLNGVPFGSKLSVHAEGATDLLETSIHRHSDTAAFGANIVLMRTRGSEASETIVQSGDALGYVGAWGFNGTDFTKAAQIAFEVDGTPGASDMPGRIRFLVTPDGSTTLAEALRISQDTFALFADGVAVTNKLKIGGTTASTAQCEIYPASTSTVGLLIRSLASHTVNVTRFENSSGTAVLGINTEFATGNLNVINGFSSAQTYATSALIQFNKFSNKLTFNTGSSWFIYADIVHELEFNDIPNSFVPHVGIYYRPTLRMKSGSLITAGQPAVYSNQSIIADGFALTASSILAAFHDNPTFSQVNGGSYTSLNHTSFISAFTTGASVAATSRIGYDVSTVALGSGSTLATQIGFRVQALSGATDNISLQVLGAGGSRHVPKIKIGADSTPSAMVDILNTASTDVGLSIKGAASQSANLTLLERSDGTDVLKVSPYGKLSIHPDTIAYTGSATDHLAFEILSNVTGCGSAAIDTAKISPLYTFSTGLAFGFLGAARGLLIAPTWRKDAGLGAGSDSATLIGTHTSLTYDAASRTLSSMLINYSQAFSTSTSTITEVVGYQADALLNGPTTTFEAFRFNSLLLGLGTAPTTVIGVQLDDYAGASTTKIGFYQKGVNFHNRFTGDCIIGTDATPTAYLELKPAARTSVTTEKSQLLGSAQTLTLTSGATVTNQRQYQFTAPVINGIAGGGAETVTNAATLYVSGEPTGANIVFTNGPYALWVDSGISRLDGALDLRGKFQLNSAQTVTLTADNQVVTVGDSSYIRISSDNTTATNRTFVLTQSTLVGHVLVIEWTHATNRGELVDDSAQSGAGNHRLNATWTPTGANQTLYLISNGTDWVELGRSLN